jgi:hypothetical protein
MHGHMNVKCLFRFCSFNEEAVRFGTKSLSDICACNNLTPVIICPLWTSELNQFVLQYECSLVFAVRDGARRHLLVTSVSLVELHIIVQQTQFIDCVQKMKFTHQVKIFTTLFLFAPEVPLACPQKPIPAPLHWATWLMSTIFRPLFNIIFQSIHNSAKLFLPVSFCDLNTVCVSDSYRAACYWLRHSHCSDVFN